MSFSINDLTKHQVRDDTKYFFDANIWLTLLSTQFNLKANTKSYLDFFEKVAKHNKNTKIVFTSFLLSEVINRILRDVSMRKFAKKNGVDNPDKSYYKMIYRKDQQYNIDYETLCDDIKSYHNALEFTSDEFGSYKPKDILKSPPTGLDFNDHLSVKLAQKNNMVIVTDDSDFMVEDIMVLTCNRTLLQSK